MNYNTLIQDCFINCYWDNSLKTPQNVPILEEISLSQEVTINQVIDSNEHQAIYTNKVYKINNAFVRVVYGRFLGQFYIEISESNTNPLECEISFSEDTRHGVRLNIPASSFEQFCNLRLDDLLDYLNKMEKLELNPLIDFIEIKTLKKLWYRDNKIETELNNTKSDKEKYKKEVETMELVIKKIKKVVKNWKKYNLIVDLLK